MATFYEYIVKQYGKEYDNKNWFLTYFQKHIKLEELHIVDREKTRPCNIKDIKTDFQLIDTVEGMDAWRKYSDWFVDNTKQYNKSLKSKDAKKYIYMITFTLSEENKDKGDEALEYIRNQAQRKALRIMHYEYAEELTKKGVRHWHLVIQTERPLKKDRFNYYIAKYGNIDFSSTKAQILDNALNYINKTNISVCLIRNGQCASV